MEQFWKEFSIYVFTYLRIYVRKAENHDLRYWLLVGITQYF